MQGKTLLNLEQFNIKPVIERVRTRRINLQLLPHTKSQMYNYPHQVVNFASYKALQLDFSKNAHVKNHN
jgi:hypothetical protein